MVRIDDRVAAIVCMSVAEARDAWQQRFGETAPALSLSLLRRALAHAEQEDALGGLSAHARKVLEAMASADIRLPDPPIKLKPGTRLLREWNGTMHSVLVIQDGIVFGDRRYASLSEVARVITGAHWSGPRFFGLKRPVNPPVNGGAHG